MRTARLAVPTAILLVAALTGCGGDDSGDGSGDAEASTPSLTGDEQTAADNLASQIIRSGNVSQGASGSSVTEEQATCIAEGAVAEVGLAELQEYGILTEELLVDKSIQGVRMRAQDADALAAVFVDCIDAEGLFEKKFLEGLPRRGAEQDRRECVEEAVRENDVRDVLAASFQGRRSPAYVAMVEDVTSCAGGSSRGK